VEDDQKLIRGLSFAKLEARGEAQERGFAALSSALAQQGGRLEERLVGVQAVVVQTHTRRGRRSRQPCPYYRKLARRPPAPDRMSRWRGRAAGHAVQPGTGAAPFSAIASPLSPQRTLYGQATPEAFRESLTSHRTRGGCPRGRTGPSSNPGRSSR